MNRRWQTSCPAKPSKRLDRKLFSVQFNFQPSPIRKIANGQTKAKIGKRHTRYIPSEILYARKINAPQITVSKLWRCLQEKWKIAIHRLAELNDLPKFFITAGMSSCRRHCVRTISESDLLDEVVQMKLSSASYSKRLVVANTVQHLLINFLKSFLFHLMGNGTRWHANPSWPPEFKVWPLKAFRGITIGTVVPGYIRINFLVRINHGDAVVLKAWPLEPGTLIVPEPSDQTKSTEKIAPYFKGTPALPPLDWEKSQHYKWWCDVWRMWCFQWNYWIPHRKFRK